MDYSSDKNYVTGLTQNVFSRKTCLGEFDDFSVILASKWGHLENFKQAELNANEWWADCNENLVGERNTGTKIFTWVGEKKRFKNTCKPEYEYFAG